LSSAKFVIGIDLGTTNCSLAFADMSAADAREPTPVTLFSIEQLVNPGEVRVEALLPSFLYLPGPADFPPGTLELPWGLSRYVTGTLAQKRGAEAPARGISSAKSWLSYAGVSRSSPILPPNAPEGVEKMSPLAVSREYLNHIRHAWDQAHPDAPLEAQQVLVTVPASFDAVARELTLKAAEEAAYRGVTLLEEPQAAFYAWIERHPDWRERVAVGDLILVCDVGGGTTDFTLIAVTASNGELQLERVAVGEHLLLGGDNIDLALARFVEHQLSEKGTKLDALQVYALWQQCRLAKERLLAPDNKSDDAAVTILGRGTGLVGGTIKAKLKRADLDQILLNGFLPVVSSSDLPQRRARAALAEMGLPYASDPAMTKHLARFLRQQAATAEHGTVRRGKSGLACPTHILFNGGVLRANVVRERIIEVLNSWLREEGLDPVKPLLGEDLMHAVSRGAAYYGMSRQGRGVRIRGGVPRTYYVGIESSMPAVPGIPAPLKALTVAAFGMEEGTAIDLPNREFGLVVGEPAEFRFFNSATRKNDAPGNMIEDVGEDLEELSPIEVNLPADGCAGEFVPVTLETVVTETGLLQLWCVAKDGRRWKLEFNVRERVTQS
jgi:molecular chaperone DnaK (HSP70)